MRFRKVTCWNLKLGNNGENIPPEIWRMTTQKWPENNGLGILFFENCLFSGVEWYLWKRFPMVVSRPTNPSISKTLNSKKKHVLHFLPFFPSQRPEGVNGSLSNQGWRRSWYPGCSQRPNKKGDRHKPCQRKWLRVHSFRSFSYISQPSQVGGEKNNAKSLLPIPHFRFKCLHTQSNCWWFRNPALSSSYLAIFYFWSTSVFWTLDT